MAQALALRAAPTMEDDVAEKMRSRKDQDRKMSMKGNLGQQEAQREKRSDDDLKHMGERTKDTGDDQG